MNPKHMWICLFLAFCSASPSNACKWIRSQYKIISGACLSHLQEMGGEFSRVSIPFPDNLYNLYRKIEVAKVEDQVMLLAEITEQITELFNSDLGKVKWDNRALDNFLNILYTRQLKELKSCVAAHPETKEQRLMKRRLKKHFRKLKNLLKKANYSADSWEQIRKLVRTHLERMDIIASNLKTALSR